MRKQVLFSAAAHGVIVALALVAFPSPEELAPVQTRALPVELVTIDEFTNLKSQKRVDKPKPVDKPEPPKPPAPEKPKAEPTPEPTPPVPEEKAEPIPEKEVEKVEKKPEPKPVEKKVEKPKPPQKPPEPKKTFDPNQIAALLDKTPDAAPQTKPQETTEEDFDAPETDDPNAKLTMSEIDAIRQRVQRCWNVRDFAGSAEADKLFARIDFTLNQDGSIAGWPSIRQTSGGPLSRLFAERAIQAVQKCAPYDFLPPNKFTNWRDVELTFNMSGMM